MSGDPTLLMFSLALLEEANAGSAMCAGPRNVLLMYFLASITGRTEDGERKYPSRSGGDCGGDGEIVLRWCLLIFILPLFLELKSVCFLVCSVGKPPCPLPGPLHLLRGHWCAFSTHVPPTASPASESALQRLDPASPCLPFPGPHMTCHCYPLPLCLSRVASLCLPCQSVCLC